jgi:hypothetical protein
MPEKFGFVLAEAVEPHRGVILAETIQQGYSFTITAVFGFPSSAAALLATLRSLGVLIASRTGGGALWPAFRDDMILSLPDIQQTPRNMHLERIDSVMLPLRIIAFSNHHYYETRKYKGKRLVCCASGSSFENAMIHATMLGMELDETENISAALGTK